MSNGSALIVGVGPGLGMALAEAFARDGHPVALLGRDAERLGQFVSELETAGHRAHAYLADAADAAGLRIALVRAVDDLGPPEVAIYNAAVLAPDTPTDLDVQTFAHRLAVNVTGAMVAAQTVLPLLAGGRGTLLFTGGAYGLNPSPTRTSLSVGKAAMRAYVYALHKQQQGTNVHVTTVTVAGNIGGDDPRFAAETLAAAYLDLHRQPRELWQAELLYA
jgi:short-subunit dehydrogenase